MLAYRPLELQVRKVNTHTTKQQNPSVLVIDDEPTIVELLEMLLEDEFCVTGCLDSRQALTKAAALVPDLIILDVMMPGPNGVQILRNLRRIESLENVTGDLMTARTTLDQ